MSDVRRLLAHAAARLAGDEARFEAELLLAHVLGRSRTWLFAWPEFVPGDERVAHFEALVAARVRGEPVAYLTGRREFWSLDLDVTPDVLIPRPDTELLVELALVRIPLDTECALADLGTGSGAIALALAHERPRASVLATDASAAALAVARANARRLQRANVAFAQGDWYAALGQRRFDLIASNPPYIAAADRHLGEGDLRFEPAAALASGADGLDAIRTLVAGAAAHLHSRGWLLLEHGWDQATDVRALLLASAFDEVASYRDRGGHERVSAGRVGA